MKRKGLQNVLSSMKFRFFRFALCILLFSIALAKQHRYDSLMFWIFYSLGHTAQYFFFAVSGSSKTMQSGYKYFQNLILLCRHVHGLRRVKRVRSLLPSANCSYCVQNSSSAFVPFVSSISFNVLANLDNFLLFNLYMTILRGGL